MLSSLFEKSALTSSEWSDRYPEVKIKPFRLQAFFSKHTLVVNILYTKLTSRGLDRHEKKKKKSRSLVKRRTCAWSPITLSVFLPESSGSFESSPLADQELPAKCPSVTSSVRLLRFCSPTYFSCCGGERKHVQIPLKSRWKSDCWCFKYLAKTNL